MADVIAQSPFGPIRWRDMGDGTYAEVGSIALVNPNVFKTVTTVAAGATAIWTPAAGKKFTLMGYSLDVTGDATLTTAGHLEVTFLDGSTPIGVGESLYVPAVALNAFGGFQTPWMALGNTGYESLTAGNVLSINLSAALTAGELRVVAIGIEQ